MLSGNETSVEELRGLMKDQMEKYDKILQAGAVKMTAADCFAVLFFWGHFAGRSAVIAQIIEPLFNLNNSQTFATKATRRHRAAKLAP